MEKKQIIYCVPKTPYNGSNYNGILSLSHDIANALSDKFEFRQIEFSFLHLSTLKKTLVDYLPTLLGNQIITPQDFLLSASDVDLLKTSKVVHYWHPEFAGINLGNKTIVTCLGLELFPGHRQKFFESVFDRAAVIHSVSKSTNQLIYSVKYSKSHLWAKKLITIYPCVDVNKFTRAKKHMNKPLVIGTLARLVSEKNILNIVTALSLLKNNYKLEFEYLLAGAGPEGGMIISMLDLYRIPFKYLGEISDKDKVSGFYHKIDLFVLPALPIVNQEGIGVAYFEASAAGVPIITSKDIHQPKDRALPGVYANPLDPKSIAEKIISVINSWDSYHSKTAKWIGKFTTTHISSLFDKIYSAI